MNTYGHPHPIPYYEQALGTAPMGALGNGAFPVALLEMPISAASYLYYRAKTISREVEWTPLLEGPGSTLDYTGATGWDGSKFLTTSAINLLDPLAVSYVPAEEVSDQEKRDEIRGYALTSAQLDPWPGKWMGIRNAYVETGNVYGVPQESAVSGVMKYDLPGMTFEEAQLEFEEANATALTAWATRLSDWLAAEQAKVPPDAEIIADIERQQAAETALATQVNEQAALVVTATQTTRQNYISTFGWTETEADKLARNLFALEQEAFARWIAAEEKLEAYAITTGPLWRLRVPFRKWVEFELQRNFGGWVRSQNPAAPGDIFEYGLTGAIQRPLTTDAFNVFSTAQVPALCTASLVMRFPELPTITSLEDLKNAGTAACATIFETYSDPYPYPNGICSAPPETLTSEQLNGICSEQVQSIARVAIGPRYIGTSPELVAGSTLKGDLPATRTLFTVLDCELLSGVIPDTFPTESFSIFFPDVFDLATGLPKDLNLEGVLPYEGSKAWAFKSPYAIYSEGPPESVDVGPLHALWEKLGQAWADYNVSSAYAPGIAVGTFQIVSLGGKTLLQKTLYASANTVTALNLTLRVIEER